MTAKKVYLLTVPGHLDPIARVLGRATTTVAVHGHADLIVRLKAANEAGIPVTFRPAARHGVRPATATEYNDGRDHRHIADDVEWCQLCGFDRARLDATGAPAQ